MSLDKGHTIDVLDKGFVRLVDWMGTDDDIVEAARVSYDPESTTRTSSPRQLIRYLMRHRHSSPFEMVEVKLHMKLPVFVARQWIRHRTANVNEVSGRYSIIRDEFHMPKSIRRQSKKNRQGSDGGVELPQGLMESWVRRQPEEAFHVYNQLVDENTYDVAREQARINLPLSIYTAWYWKTDLHNLFHLLTLRTDEHAQLEIREYAWAIERMVCELFPLAWEAWVDYQRDAQLLSRMAMEMVYDLVAIAGDEHVHRMIEDRVDLADGEKKELISAFGLVA